jgi:hypothetical protein
VFEHVEHLQAWPENGNRPPELIRSRYRQIVESPCRVFYRYGEERVAPRKSPRARKKSAR